MPDLDLAQTAVAICLGIGLAAACGVRVFIPPLLLGIGRRLELPLAELGPEWVGSWPAIAAFAAASLFELGAYYVPWLDNALDTVASPLAVVAGILLTAGVTGDLDPTLRWVLAVVAGGGAAGVTQTASVLTRALSTATTGGLGNFLVSTGEAVGAIFMTVLAMLLAPLAVLLFLLVGFWCIRLVVKRRARREFEAGAARG